jgi:hypothetical protein
MESKPQRLAPLERTTNFGEVDGAPNNSSNRLMKENLTTPRTSNIAKIECYHRYKKISWVT